MEELDRLGEQVVEIEATAAFQQRLVGVVDLGRHLFVVDIGPNLKRMGLNELRLGGGYQAENATRRELLGVDLHLFHRPLYDLYLVAVVHDDIVARDADGFAVAPEDPSAQGVKGACA